jgi:hypothetical protein
MRIDEIKNTQKNGGRGERIVVNLQRWDITKPFIPNFVYRKEIIKASLRDRPHNTPTLKQRSKSIMNTTKTKQMNPHA